MNRVFLIALLVFNFSWAYGQDLPEELPTTVEEDDEFLDPADLGGENDEAGDFVEEEEDVSDELAAEEVPADEDAGELPSSFVVEQEYIAIRRTEHVEDAIPLYKDRRDRWGYLFSLGYGMGTPVNYVPNFNQTQTFSDHYGSAGAIELTFSKKLNLAFGAFLLGGGVGYYKVSSSGNTDTLTVIPIRVEGALILDTLFDEPLAAPYVAGGVYINSYSETGSSGSVDGNTQVAPYFGGGINLQMDWMDRSSALNAYLDYGLENTFLFVEGRMFVASSAAGDPDFSTDVHLVAGAKLEY